MTISSWPFDDQAVSETQFSQWANMLETSGIQDDGFAVSPSSGLTLAVTAGLGLVRGHAVYLDANTTVTLDAATSNPRIDIVVLRLDPTANTITVEVVKGTPASSPSAPALTQTVADNYELPIAQVLVPASASVINSGNITDQRVILHAALDADDISDATTVGKALLRAASASDARTTIGATATGTALFTAASASAVRTTAGITSGTSDPSDGDGKPDGTIYLKVLT